MEVEALPQAEQAQASEAIETTAREVPEAEAKPEGEAKPDTRTPEQIRIDELERSNKRLQRAVDRRTRRIGELSAQGGLTRQSIADINATNADDSQPLSLTPAEFREAVKREAQKLAPTLADQHKEVERRTGVIESLAKTWGQEKFDEVASDLDEAFGGLQDAQGTPKAAIEAVFEADNPARVIEWLSDPENADEAERISKLSGIQAGKAIAKLEVKLEAEDAKSKPKPSKVPAPLEPIRGAARNNGMPDPKNTREWMAWRNDQERKGLA